MYTYSVGVCGDLAPDHCDGSACQYKSGSHVATLMSREPGVHWSLIDHKDPTAGVKMGADLCTHFRCSFPIKCIFLLVHQLLRRGNTALAQTHLGQ